MNDVIKILKEQWTHIGMIFRISKYEDKATYQSHYLGMLWQFLNPAVQVGVYFLVFGLGLRSSGQKDGVPYLVWMLVGIVPWFFMSSCLLGTSKSIYTKLNLISKMKFPLSILPSVNITSNLVSYFAMLVIVIISILSNNLPINIYWLQYFYYFICMISFMFACGIFSSTISVLVRDYHIALQSLVRLLFYLSGPIIDISKESFPPFFSSVLSLNPLAYIISGFRDTFIFHRWFFESPALMIYFWGLTFIILFIGCYLHNKFRARFVDFI